MHASRVAVQDIDEVLVALDTIVDQAIAGKSRAGFFASMYRQVTLAVKRAIDAGQFDDNERMSRFDAAFAERYLHASAQWHGQLAPSKSWKLAFDATDHPDRVVVQHLLLGVNAHINLDLGVAAATVAPGVAIFNLEADFGRINDILVGVLHDVQEVLNRLSPLMKVLDDIGGRSDEEIIGFNVRAARQDAWNHAVILAFQAPAERERTIDVLDRKAAFLGRILNDPGPLLRPALQLIRLTEAQDVAEIIGALDRTVDLRRV